MDAERAQQEEEERLEEEARLRREETAAAAAAAEAARIERERLNALTPEQRMAQAMEMFARNQEQMIEMQRLLVTMQSRSATPATSPIKEPKAKDPDTFNGKQPAKLPSFLFECDMVFKLQPSRFLNDETKINYMIGYLRESALDAVRPLTTEEPEPEELYDYKKFVRFLKESFGDPDELGTARRKLKALRQTGSAAEYFVKFKELVATLRWSTTSGPVVDRAVDGLNADLKDEVARGGREFDTLNELSQFIIPLDNRLRARDVERKQEEKEKELRQNKRDNAKSQGSDSSTSSKSKSKFSAPTSSTSSTSTRETVISTTSSDETPPNDQSYQPRFTRLSDGEKERRTKEGRCFRCGERGHMKTECPRNSITPLNPKEEPSKD